MEDDSKRDYEINREKIRKTSKGVFGFFVMRRKIAVLLTIMIVVWGAFSLWVLPREANPEVEIPIAIVTTVWPGASPEDIENDITNEIEKKLKNLDNLKNLSSSSSNSLSTITVEFDAGADLDKSIRELRDAVDTVSGLPDGITDRPLVTEININDSPIITFSLISDLSEPDLKRLARQIKDEIESVSGVSQVVIAGDRDREWVIGLNQGKINQLKLNPSDIAQAITRANITLPLGSLEIDNKIYDLRSVGEIKSVEALGSVVVLDTPRQGTVLLRDISDIKDRLEDPTTISRLARAGDSPYKTLSLQVFKQTGGNIIEIVDTTKSKIRQLQNSNIIPKNVDVVVTNDMSRFVRKDFGTLTRSGVQTLILIFISLALVLAVRMAVVAVISIPIIFFMSFGIISLQGATLNSITLFSLVLSLGLLIDTTIILLEGIYDGISKGYSRKEAALLSIATYKWPIISGVLTTVAAFVPMLLVGGIVGGFLKTLPLTIGAVLGSSLIVGLLIMPAISTYIMKNENIAVKNNGLQEKLYSFVRHRFRPMIRGLLLSKKKRYLLGFGVTFLVFACFALFATGIIKMELFPKTDFDFMIVNIELEQGSVLEDTEKVTAKVEEVIGRMEELDNYLTVIGRSTVLGIARAGGSLQENLASITITLKDKSERERKSYEISKQLRKNLSNIQGANIIVQDIEDGPPSSDPIGMQVRGEDLSVLSDIASEIKSMLRTIDGVEDISSSDKPSPPQFVFNMNHEKIGKFGLTAEQISRELRIALFGLDVGTVRSGEDDIDIVVKYADGSVSSIGDIKNMEITNARGERIKVFSLVDTRTEPSLQTIRHRDTKRTVFISARNEGRTVSEIQSEINDKIKNINIPTGYTIVQSGEFEDQNEAFYDLYKAMSVAVLLIFFIMVLQFDSFRQPFAIILTLPLAFVGVIIGIFVFGMPFGFPTFLGVVALGGIVVNDAIVLIDRINFNIRVRKMHIDDAIVNATETRLQPIILTTTTTALGVIPLAFADEFWRGLSVAIATGIVFATVLTLFIIPIVYRGFEYKTFSREYPDNKSVL